ncbi:MAG: lysophospholipid acyltransferase family protein [Alphaproteobacteria bacterium]
MKQVKYLFETAGFFLIIGFFKLFAIDTASAIGGWIGRNFIAPTGMSRRALANLHAAFPDKNETEIRNIISGMWDNLGRVMAEYAHLSKLTYIGENPRIEVVGLENLRAAQAYGKGILIISAHFANWEIMPCAARQYGLLGGVVVRPTNNPYVSRWLDRQRSRYGMPEQISKGAQGTRRIFSLLRKGDCILMLVDQRTSEGVPAPFFGREAMTTPAPAALAIKLGAVILPVWNERVGGARFRMHVQPIIERPRSGDEDRDVLAFTAKINAWVEARVRERPEQWLWIHRRWSEKGSKLRKRAQSLAGAGDEAANEGSSLT